MCGLLYTQVVLAANAECSSDAWRGTLSKYHGLFEPKQNVV